MDPNDPYKVVSYDFSIGGWYIPAEFAPYSHSLPEFVREECLDEEQRELESYIQQDQAFHALLKQDIEYAEILHRCTSFISRRFQRKKKSSRGMRKLANSEMASGTEGSLSSSNWTFSSSMPALSNPSKSARKFSFKSDAISEICFHDNDIQRKVPRHEAFDTRIQRRTD